MSFSDRSGGTMQTASRVSRRALLSGAATSLALPLLPRAARAQSLPMTCLVPSGYVDGETIPDAAWQELGDPKNMTGGVQRPNDPRFVWLTQPENLRYYNPPANPGGTPDCDAPFGVVRPHSPKEVAYAIQWAQKWKVPMVPRSGGHSYAGCSTVAGLVINSSAMRSVEYIEKDNRLVVEGGAIFGNLLESLRDMEVKKGEKGRYTITHGRCRDVGLSAFLMGGGWAIDSSYLGMGCDRVKKVELVLADGQIVIASDDVDNKYRDLFWAVRGGGGGTLAYATKWWLEPLVVENVVVFGASWRLNYGAAFKVFQTLFRALDVTPPTMGAQMTVSATPASNNPWPYVITLRCVFHGKLDEFKQLLGSAIDKVKQEAESQCGGYGDACLSNDLLELPYWDAQEFFEERAYPNRYQETSLFARDITDDFIAKMFDDWFYTRPQTIQALRATVYRVGGKVNEIEPDATAFVHRKPYKWMITTDLDWSNPHDPNLPGNLAHQRKMQNAFSDLLGNPGSYQNFPDPGLKDPAAAYWGSNLARLSQIKKKYDPNSVFTPPRNQGIP